MVPTVLLPPAMPSTVQAAAPPPGTLAVNCWVRVSVMAAVVGERPMVALETVSVAEAGVLLPPAPLQVNEYVVVVALTAPVFLVPLVPSALLQPPDAAHEVALLELQVNVDEPPGAITEGYTESLADGTIFTVAVAGALVPPVPVHVSENVVLAVSAPVLRLPLAAKVALHPPEAVQEVALVEDQVSVADPPALIVWLDAPRVAVGNAAAGVAGADDEPPPQADRTDTAAKAPSEVMRRMKSRGDFFSILIHGARAGAKKTRGLRLCPGASQGRFDYVT
jgi:hypothetical protein